MDPIGFPLENVAVGGGCRRLDNGIPIDTGDCVTTAAPLNHAKAVEDHGAFAGDQTH